MERRKFILSSTLLLGGMSVGKLALPKKKIMPLRFGIVTDIHYADRSPHGTRYYRQSQQKIAECVDLMNEQKVEFLLENGDFKDEGAKPDEQETLKFLDTIEKELSRFNGPIYHVLGNHDMDCIAKEQFLSKITNTGFPQAQSYYSFNMGTFHFVVLDANYTSKGVSYNKGNYDWKDAHIPDEQLAWLKKDLQANQKPTVVFVHQQLDSAEYGKDHLIYGPDNADAVRNILEDSGNVLIVFQGHYHTGGFHKVNNIYYYTLKAVIEGDGATQNSYAIVEIEEDMTIKINGYRRAVSKKLS